MDRDGIIYLVGFGLMSVGSLALALRLTRTRRRLRRHGVTVEASVDESEVSYPNPGRAVHVNRVSFETESGERITKRFKTDSYDDYLELIYDPDNPQRAWPPDNILGKAATAQVGCLWVFGVAALLMFLIGLAAF